MKLLIRWVVYALAIGLSAYLLPGVTIAGIGSALVLAIVLGLINIFLRPVFILLTLPLTIFSLGLFLFVINALLILLADALMAGFEVANFWWALLFSLILFVIHNLFRDAVQEAKK